MWTVGWSCAPGLLQLDMKVLVGIGRASSFSAVLDLSSELHCIEMDGLS